MNDLEINITGGADSSNPDLIDWLESNGTLTELPKIISLDLSTLDLPEGVYEIQMKLSDDGVTHADSELSNTVTYHQQSPIPRLASPVISYQALSDKIIEWDDIDNNQGYDILIDGVKKAEWEPPVVEYPISVSLNYPSHGSYNGDTTIAPYGTATINVLTVSGSGWYVPSDSSAITVSNASFSYARTDYNTGAITLSNPTGDVVVSINLWSCFPAGTQILVDFDGNTRNIEDLQSGDPVVSYNPNSGELYMAEIRKAAQCKPSALATITFENGKSLDITTNHPLLTKEGWKTIETLDELSLLKVGDYIKDVTGWQQVVDIVNHGIDPSIQLYTIDVNDRGEDPDIDDNDCYFAEGFCVHNTAN